MHRHEECQEAQRLHGDQVVGPPLGMEPLLLQDLELDDFTARVLLGVKEQVSGASVLGKWPVLADQLVLEFATVPHLRPR